MMEKAGYDGSYKQKSSGELEITLMGVLCFGRRTGFGFRRGKTLSLASLGCMTMLHSFVLSRYGSVSHESYRWATFHVLYNPSRGDVKLGQDFIGEVYYTFGGFISSFE